MEVGKTVVHPEWRLLLAAFRNVEYGAMISHEEIEGVCGIKHSDTDRYFSTVTRWRKAMLEEAGRELESVYGEGYRACLPSEYHDRSRRQIKLAGRRIRAAKSVLQNAPVHLLTDHEKSMHADALAKFATLEQARAQVYRSTRRKELPHNTGAPK